MASVGVSSAVSADPPEPPSGLRSSYGSASEPLSSSPLPRLAAHAAPGASAASAPEVVALSERSIRYVPAASTLSASPGTSRAAAQPPTLPLAQWLFPRENLPPLFWTKAKAPGAGLVNPSALCFMNAVLQALAYTPGFAEHLLDGRHTSTCPVALTRREARRRKGEGETERDNGAREDRTQSAGGLGCAYTPGRPGEDGRRASDARGGRREKGQPGTVSSDVSFSFCVLCKLEEQVKSLHRRGGGCVENRFSSCVRQFVWKSFRQGRQEDAHEFLRFLLDALIRVHNSGSSPLSSSTKKEAPPEVWMTSLCGQIFGGWLQSSIRCSRCPYTSIRFDPCLDVPVDLGRDKGDASSLFRMKKSKRMKKHEFDRHRAKADGVCTLEKALHRFVQKEYLDGDNCYNCPQCKKKQPATKQLQIHTPPRILVLPIKRFTVSGCSAFSFGFLDSAFLGKNHTALAYPSLLNLTPFMTPPQRDTGVTEKASASLFSLSASVSSASSVSVTSVSSLSTFVSKSGALEAERRDGCPASPQTCSTRASSAFSPSPAGSPPTSTSPTPSSPPSPSLYQLYAVITHSGSSLSSGHYRCFVKMPTPPASLSGVSAVSPGGDGGVSSSAWLMLDDEMVRMVSETLVLHRLQEEAYLLFYARVPSPDDFVRHDSRRARGQSATPSGIPQNTQEEETEERSESPGSPSSSGSDDSDLDSDEVVPSDLSDDSWAGDSSSRSSEDGDMLRELLANAAEERESGRRQLSAFLIRREAQASRFLSRRLRTVLRAATSSLLRAAPEECDKRKQELLEKLADEDEEEEEEEEEDEEEENEEGEEEKDEEEEEEVASGSVGVRQETGQKRKRDAMVSRADREDGEHQAGTNISAELLGDENARGTAKRKETRTRSSDGSGFKSFHIVTPEDMVNRIAAARSYTSQYGIQTPGNWADDSDGGEETSAQQRDAAFEKLQEMQQPRSARRERHDREYDRGKVKKVKRKEPKPTVGASVSHESASADPSLVVHQRAAFDKVLAEKKNRGHRMQRLGAASGAKASRKFGDKGKGRHHGKGNKKWKHG
ncbi:hypothetical protein NCLIV_046080 [Neospora caninum Liverpool]|uniref:ubiquitinyl hydrolase 1 n=1 Tax=Neospora caninum (strain Liverpool) TaxID=572307 RepID=F0VLP8_NEOCL|nr:hypothetical protein NCLIV_046080 [Neospora caninum Liverpool]CBZ54176.1 hypothetical protein NCLIV_046080 [Neospora caninum Liverpool]CEL68877.1 TPA: Ubiquitin carboxyl-terminal hydrolase 23 [Neospora caninum Liverpool]|eukprot:XP_003884207.1 hypothetical protein NCLIV_046080 [Neospora caninum Liverpool]